jgi:hypothetical protein
MMSEELNLDNLKKLMAHIDGDSPCEHIHCMYALVSACPLLIAEVERLRQESADFEAVCMSQEGQIARLMAELATAKKIGAAEELERMAEPYIHEYLAGSQYLALANRPWECTQGLKNSINDCLKCELLNRAAELRAEGEA